MPSHLPVVTRRLQPPSQRCRPRTEWPTLIMEDLVQVVKSQLKEKNLQGMLEVYNIQESSLSSSEDDEESSILERSDLWLVKCKRRG
jgi:hypothetical protein